MKKASLLIIPILLLNLLIAHAQVDQKAKAVLDRLSAKTKSYTSYRVNFTFVLNRPEMKAETVTGILSVKGSKYHLKMAEQEIFCDGKNVTTYQIKTNEAMVQDVEDMDEDAITPQKIFMMYESGFKIRFVKDATENGKKLAVVELYPLDPKKKDYSIITLYVDDAAQSMVRAEIKAKNGSKYIYSVTKMEPNLSLGDNVFLFDTKKYPGVKVIR